MANEKNQVVETLATGKPFLFKSVVISAGRNEDKKAYILLEITPEQEEKLTTKLELKPDVYKHTPIKINDETGEQMLKASTSFNIKVYENGEDSDLQISDIGAGSEVEVFAALKITKKMRGVEPSQVLYMKQINVLKYVEPQHYNPFTDNNAEEI